MPTFCLRHAAALLALVAATPAAAQDAAPEEPVLPLPGTHSLSLSHDNGSSMIGLGRMVGARTKLEIGVAADIRGVTIDPASGDDIVEGSNGLTVRAGVRRYSRPESRIAPYLMAGMSGFHHRRTQDGGSAGRESRLDGKGVGIDAGGGVEWFPVARVGISGQAGISAAAFRQRHRSSSPDGSPQVASHTHYTVGTFTSALSISLYF